MELHTPDDVASLFVHLCRQLRDMGANSVKAFGCVATFGPMSAPLTEPDERDREAPIPMSVEAKELHERAKRLADGALR